MTIFATYAFSSDVSVIGGGHRAPTLAARVSYLAAVLGGNAVIRVEDLVEKCGTLFHGIALLAAVGASVGDVAVALIPVRAVRVELRLHRAGPH